MKAARLAMFRTVLSLAASICWRLAVYDNWHFARAPEQFEQLARKLSEWKRWTEELR